MPNAVNAEVVELLTQHIHSLPHDEYGVINMLPFVHDSDATKLVTRHFCEAIANLLDSHGLLKPQETDGVVKPLIGESRIQCRACRNTIAEIVISDGETAVDAAMFIAGVASVNPECPHKVITPDDMRVHMQREFDKMIEEEAQP